VVWYLYDMRDNEARDCLIVCLWKRTAIVYGPGIGWSLSFGVMQ